MHRQETIDRSSVRPDRVAALESRQERLDRFRRFLKLETERLRMRHRMGLGGVEIAAGRSDQVDALLEELCLEISVEGGEAAGGALPPWAVVALGGYGRRDLAPHSDVDLLFLHPGGGSAELKPFVERTLQVLWDVGLTVGHSFRSPRECVAEARRDLHSRTALIDARLVTGNAALFHALSRQLDSDLHASRRATDGFVESMKVELRQRWEKFGGAVCLLEPNVKEGPGGLRDLHAMLWVGHARWGTRGLAGLKAEGWLGEREFSSARRASGFLSRVRNEAHFTGGRRTDLLTLDVQGDLARNLGYVPRGGLLASELLMREYYRRASELHECCRAFMRVHLKAPRRQFPGLSVRRRPRKGFEVRGGELTLRSGGSALHGGPGAVMDAFRIAQEEGVPLSEDLKSAIRVRTRLIGRGFRASREATGAFLRLVQRRGRVAPALRAMHETGVLACLVPEWARITFLVQHDFFHKYTVDEHTLKAVEALDEVAAGQDPALAPLGRLFDELPDVLPVYLGMLLHDIGKGRGGGHVVRGVAIARRIAGRLRLAPETAEKILFLVGAHLEMSQVSQHRDLTEASLIDAFAARMGSLERLNALLLLTYADHRGVGPGIWNEWKATLLWELYSRTRPRLAGGEPREDDGDASARERAFGELRSEAPGEEVEGYLAGLPERYFRATDAAGVVRHFRLLRGRGARPFACEWRDLGDGRGTELALTAEDRPGLFAALAGTLTASGVDILSVDLFTRADGVALDTFHVAELPGHRPVAPGRCARIESALAEAVAGRVDVGRSVERWRSRAPRRARRHWGRTARPATVRFDQEASAVSTVVEVKAPDEPGLAYRIASTLAELGLDITFARVATAKALALDVFYVRGGDGSKLAPPAMREVEEALLAALGSRPRVRAHG